MNLLLINLVIKTISIRLIIIIIMNDQDRVLTSTKKYLFIKLKFILIKFIKFSVSRK